MNLKGITPGVRPDAPKPAATAPAEEKEREQQPKEARRDSVQVGQKAPGSSGVYTRSQLSNTQVQSLVDQHQAQMDHFWKTIQSMLVGQGQKSNLTIMGMDLFVTPEQSAQAAQAIAPGGEYSVDAVAGRILDMAKALSGGDSGKIEELRSSVQKGFEAAGAQWGSKLPGICDDTYQEVMKRFDDWKNEAAQ